MVKLIDILGYFDYITPARSLAQDVRTFRIPQDRAAEVERKLRRAGIKMKNVSYLPDVFVFDVASKDAGKVAKALR